MAIYGGPDIIEDGLVLHLDAADRNSYPLSGNSWYDLSGQGNHVTKYYDTSYNSLNGGCMNFDGSQDYAKTSSTTVLNHNTYTKIAVFRPAGVTYNIVSGGSSGQHAFWMHGTDSYLRAGHDNQWAYVSYSPGVMTNQWWIGAVTFSTTSGWVLYLNGKQVDSNSSTVGFSGDGEIRIGSFGDAANVFNGKIAIVSIYNRVLSANEVQQNYNAIKGRFGL